jgi:transcriptional antiterminator
LYEEVAFIAYHFHWHFEEIINMEHKERYRWCEEISRINKRLSGEKQKSILEV